MNQESINEPPSKRFKAESIGPINEIRTASPINGISFNGNVARVGSVTQFDVANNARILLANNRSTPVQNILPGHVLQHTFTQQGNLVKVQSPASARNITTYQRLPTPNATQIQRQQTVVSYTPTSGIQLRIPIQGHQHRNSVALIQPGSSTPSSSVVMQQPVLVQQSQGRSVLLLQQQVATGKQQQSSVVNQGVGTLVIPQTSGPRSQVNVPQTVQHQLLVQRAQMVQQANQRPISQNTVQDMVAIQPNTTQHKNIQPQPSLTSGQVDGQAAKQQKPLDDLRKKMHLLFLLLHVRCCKAHENGTICGNATCPKAKMLYRHMVSCSLGKNCKEPQCYLSKQLLVHWDSCKKEDCMYCRPISQKCPNFPKLSLPTTPTPASDSSSNVAKACELLGIRPPSHPTPQTASAVNHAKVSIENTTPVAQQANLTPKEEGNKDWKENMPENLRTHLVKELVKAVYPMGNIEDLQKPIFAEIVASAKVVEAQIFNVATSREQYYQNLADRIFKIQHDLEAKMNKQKASKNSEADTSENSNGASPAQQLEKILNRKKEELSTSDQTTSLPREIVQTSGSVSSLAQELKIKVENEIKIEPKEEPIDVHEEKISIKKKEWSRFELHKYLNPVLEKLYRLDPESIHFRQPVDPELQGIPDYFTIVKDPMDLSTIKRKLDTGMYTGPWEFIDDMWLMFENAWLFNRKSSRVHKCCTKLAEVFEPEIDIVMRTMGFCCGKKYVYYPQVLCCYGKPMCTIPVNAFYHSYQNKYVYCDHCFTSEEREEIEFSEDPSQPSTIIHKSLFTKQKNSEMTPESFAICTHCGRKQHEICCMHHEPIFPNSFVCNHCTKNPGIKRKENKYTAKNLMQTNLSTYLENRVNTFLRDNKSGAGMVTIRVHSIASKLVDIKPGMRSRFCNPDTGGTMSNNLPYIAKAIFAYQEMDGVDVCFFGMHVQEYGSDCPAPNTRRVYIAYLDSVNFFQPSVFKTSVYHEILIGYLDYVKNLGFLNAHIWACPPSEGDDYIFHCHPPDMKIPKPKRLADWYKKMLDKAIIERVVIDYKDIIKDALEKDIQNVTELPYFEGDYWPNVIDTCISELEEEEHQRKLELSGELEESDSIHSNHLDYEYNNTVEHVPTGSKRNHKGATANKKRTAPKKSGLNKKNYSKTNLPYPGNDLMSKLFVMMEKHREVFFVVRLKSYNESHGKLPPIVDPDATISTEFMDGRDSFLMFCRENHYEFSSIRRVKHSSMVMLYKLHSQFKENCYYMCNICKADLEIHYHCSTCEDFDLCMSCYEKKGHEHPMEKQGLELEDGAAKASVTSSTNGGPMGSKPPNQQTHALKMMRLRSLLLSLKHALYCQLKPIQTSAGLAYTNEICKKYDCWKLKILIIHYKECTLKLPGCFKCRQFQGLSVYHAKDCNEPNCSLPNCQTIKQNMHSRRYMQDQMQNRRVAAMQGFGSGNPNTGMNHRTLNAMQRPPARTSMQTPTRPASIQPSVSQARVPFQAQSSNIRHLVPASPVVKVQGNPVAGKDTTITVSQDLLQRLFNNDVGNLSPHEAHLFALLKSTPQFQAVINKKQQDRSHSNSPVVMGEERQNIVITPSNPNVTSTQLSTPQPHQQQIRQQQVIITPNSNVGQRVGNSTLVLANPNAHNRQHIMLSQSRSNINPGSSSMPDSTLTLQDQLSRYADQL